MKIGFFHEGSGMGNQLHRYVATRVKAIDEGVPFAMIGKFKGSSFMDLQTCDTEYPVGKTIVDDNVEFIDGEFQGESVWKHRKNEVKEWLKVEPLNMPDDLCIIGFRGGEYVGVRELFLPYSYWDMAIEKVREINPNMRFEVHTDDVVTAQEFFPNFKCIHDIGLNWRFVRYAKYLIIANSSFFIFPSLLGEAKVIYAPEFWAGYNTGVWTTQNNKYDRFIYI